MSDAEQWALSTTLTSPAPLFSDEWLASEVWPAAGALISAMKRREDWLSRVRAARLVVELGSGTGACGLAAAALGAARVMLTDQSSAIPLLLENANQSRGACAVEVRTLEWRSDWSSLPADGSLPDNRSLPADGSLPDNRSLPAYGSLPDNRSLPADGSLPDNRSLPADGSLPDNRSFPDNRSLPADVDRLPDGADVVLVSDCLNPVYGATHAERLADTIIGLLQQASPSAVALIAQTAWGRCEAEIAFVKACQLKGLELQLEEPDVAACDPPNSVNIYEARLRLRSSSKPS